jgi:Insertion element 4 transposase N-terminal/Transposase DDE domain
VTPLKFEHAFSEVAAVSPATFSDIRRHIDPEWVERALAVTGTATLRRRRLPAEQVVWLVIAMALFRNRSIADVVDKLALALPGEMPSVANSAISQARKRLGPEPLKWLFKTSANSWGTESASAHRWRGLSVNGVDGSVFRVADSDENRAHFGGSNGSRGPSAYPLLRAVTLMALRSHVVMATCFGPYAAGEHTYARSLWSLVPDNSLCVVDKGFFAAYVLIPLARDGTNRHWLTRAKKNTSSRVVQQLGRKDALVEMKVSAAARAKDSSLPEAWTVRAITYQRKGFREEVLLTSLLDHAKYPAREVVALYHERWELELGYDEMKTELLDREESIRSKSPAAVEQEMWGLLLAYNLVRVEMARVAAEAGVAPTAVSFVAALRLIVDEWMWCTVASPGTIPKHLQDLRENLKRYILPPRRSERRCPRAVKIKMSNYPRKRREKPTAPGEKAN